MYKHNKQKYGSDPAIEYLIVREKIDKDPMSRVVRESIRIENAQKDKNIVLLNSKEEHFGTQTIRANFGRDGVM